MQIVQGPYLLYVEGPFPGFAEALILALRNSSDAITIHRGEQVCFIALVPVLLLHLLIFEQFPSAYYSV